PAAARFAATAAPVPPLDPPGSRSSAYGFSVSPDTDEIPNHAVAQSGSDTLARITAPAARSLLTIAASLRARYDLNTTDPNVVGISTVWARSLTTIGTPCSGPITLPSRSIRSSLSASSPARGFTLTIELIFGPFLSYASILARYRSTSRRHVTVPSRKAN